MPLVCRWLLLCSLFAFAACAREVPRPAKHVGSVEQDTAQTIGLQAFKHTRRRTQKRKGDIMGLCASLATIFVLIAWYRYRTEEKDEAGQEETEDADDFSGRWDQYSRDYDNGAAGLIWDNYSMNAMFDKGSGKVSPAGGWW